MTSENVIGDRTQMKLEKKQKRYEAFIFKTTLDYFRTSIRDEFVLLDDARDKLPKEQFETLIQNINWIREQFDDDYAVVSLVRKNK